MLDIFQNAHRQHHDTETVLLRIQHDSLNFSDRRKDVPAGLFDMSAVFNTGNHAVLINELCSVDVVVIALKWSGISVYSCYFR